jgi:dihydroorotate dehydrogenase
MRKYSLVGRKLRTPVVAAAGFQNGVDKSLIVDKFNQLLKTKIGAITLGSFTVPANEGNEIKFGAPVYYYDEKNQLTYNSIGLANIGIDQGLLLIGELAPHAKEKEILLIANGSPLANPELGSSVEQAMLLAKKLLTSKADLIELNLSCPNVVTEEGGRKPIMGYDLQSVSELVDELEKLDGTERIGLKMPPYISDEEKSLIPQLAEVLDKSHIGFLTIANTIPNQKPVDEQGTQKLSVPGGLAGMSGPATRDVGREQLQLWHAAVKNKDIISLLGVDSYDEVELRLKMGAAAAGGVTFFRESLPLSSWIKS